MSFDDTWLQGVLRRPGYRLVSDPLKTPRKPSVESQAEASPSKQGGGKRGDPLDTLQRLQEPSKDESAILLAEPERRFMERIRTLAKAHSWKCFHVYDSRRSEPGWPDMILCDGVSLLGVEVKTNTGKLTPEQQIRLSLLEHAGVETHIWKPKDWPLIEARLTRRKL